MNMLKDINDLSKYMSQTFRTQFVPVPVEVFGVPICIESHFEKNRTFYLQIAKLVFG